MQIWGCQNYSNPWTDLHRLKFGTGYYVSDITPHAKTQNNHPSGGIPAYERNITLAWFFILFFGDPKFCSLLETKSQNWFLCSLIHMTSFPRYCIGIIMQKVSVFTHFHLQNTPKRSVNGRFQPNAQNVHTFALSVQKYCNNSYQISHTSVGGHKMCRTNPRWRTNRWYSQLVNASEAVPATASTSGGRGRWPVGSTGRTEVSYQRFIVNVALKRTVVE